MGRLYHLDALRSFCMLYGILVHANTLWQPHLVPWVPLLSQHFRMATFFLISGFFVALVAQRHSMPEMLRRRGTALLVPLASALILLNPVTNYLVYLRHNPFMPAWDFFTGGWEQAAEGPGVWLLHLWFLVSLWIFVLLCPALRVAIDSAPARALLQRLSRQRGDLVVLAACIAMGFAVVAGRAIYVFGLDDLLLETRLNWVIAASLQYLPFFALGVALQAHPALFESVHRVSLPALGAGLALAVLARQAEGALPGPVATAALTFSRAFLSMAVAAALLAVSRRLIRRGTPLLRALSESIYTVYLFHFAAIYAIAHLLDGAVAHQGALFGLVVALTFAATFAVHHLVIAPVPLLRYLFNGHAPAASPHGALARG